MKRYKLLFYFIIFLTLWNSYIFFYRDDYAFVNQVAYFDLYPKISNPSVNQITTVDDSTLSIQLNYPSQQSLPWTIKKDSILYDTSNQINPQFRLQQGVHLYSIFSKNLPDSIFIKAEYHPKNYYYNSGISQDGGICIYKFDVPAKPELINIEKWKDDEIVVNAEEKKMVQQILNDSIKINAGENTFEKIKKIGNFLSIRLFHSRGMPAGSTLAASVFQQYQLAKAGKKIWCGNYAQIFNLFAHEANIKTRCVEMKTTYGRIKSNGHVFNEYFLPEQKKWAAIDMLFNNISYFDTTGNLLNAIEILNLRRTDNSIKVLQSSLKDSLILTAFPNLEPDFFEMYSRDKDLFYYHFINTKKVYSFKEKLKRYFTTEGWYEVYSNTKIYNNAPFYKKQFLFFLEIILIIILLINIVTNKFFRNHD